MSSEIVGKCDLCAGECRGHSLGRPEEWEPEPGSKAAVAAEIERLTARVGELSSALNGVLASSGARGRYHALEYADAVERAEATLNPEDRT